MENFIFCQINIKFVSNSTVATKTAQPAITCSKLTIETLEQGVKYVHWCVIVNFEYILHLVLVFLLLTLRRQMPAGYDLQNRVTHTSLGFFNPLSANPTKWSNTLKQFVGKLPTNCLSVCDHFVGLARKGLTSMKILRKSKA